MPAANLSVPSSSAANPDLGILDQVGRTGCPVNRADLISRTVRVLERLRGQNERLREELAEARGQMEDQKRAGEDLARQRKEAEAAAADAARRAAVQGMPMGMGMAAKSPSGAGGIFPMKQEKVRLCREKGSGSGRVVPRWSGTAGPSGSVCFAWHVIGSEKMLPISDPPLILSQ